MSCRRHSIKPGLDSGLWTLDSRFELTDFILFSFFKNNWIFSFCFHLKILRKNLESRVQSPESRVQSLEPRVLSPVLVLYYAATAGAEYTISPTRVSNRAEACQYAKREYNYHKHFTVRLIITEIFCDRYRMFEFKITRSETLMQQWMQLLTVSRSLFQCDELHQLQFVQRKSCL